MLIEALAVGCPVLATAIPTSLEILKADDNVVGCLTPPGDAVHLARSLDSILANPSAASARAQGGRARFEARFTTEVVDDAMAGFFRRSVNGARSPNVSRKEK